MAGERTGHDDMSVRPFPSLGAASHGETAWYQINWRLAHRRVRRLQARNAVAEPTGDESCYGFRPERSTADAIEQCFTLLAKKGSPQWILEGDIASCLETSTHYTPASCIAPKRPSLGNGTLIRKPFR